MIFLGIILKVCTITSPFKMIQHYIILSNEFVGSAKHSIVKHIKADKFVKYNS